MNNRIRQIRKEYGLTQVEFGEKIGVKGNTITNYETGLRNPTDAVLLSICREFNVNEDWLRNGTGEMFIKESKDIAITKMLGEVLKEEPKSFKRRLIIALTKLSDSDWDRLEEIINEIQEK